jgi:protein SCO1/2
MEPEEPPEIQGNGAEQPAQASSPSRPSPSTALLVATGVTVIILVLLAFVVTRQHVQQNQGIRVPGIPSNVSTPLATLMGLSPVPSRSAPAFTLTDQKGNTLSLASFKGRAVVLEFMDSHCTDICPIVSREFVDAYHDLGANASRVVFVAVNVNAQHLAVADVQAFSQEHQLSSIPSWHFFTGTLSDLQSAWSHYGIAVQASSAQADLIHSSFIFFIGPDGRERYLANPTDSHTPSGAAYLQAGELTSWGQGIAITARSLLP